MKNTARKNHSGKIISEILIHEEANVDSESSRKLLIELLQKEKGKLEKINNETREGIEKLKAENSKNSKKDQAEELLKTMISAPIFASYEACLTLFEECLSNLNNNELMMRKSTSSFWSVC